MRKEVLEQRAAEMRARYEAERSNKAKRGQELGGGRVATPVEMADLSGLPNIEPYQSVGGVWKPAHTKGLLTSLQGASELVIRTAHRVPAARVGFDGLLSLGGEDALDCSVSTARLIQALRLYDDLIHEVEAIGGTVELTEKGTFVRINGEAERVRLREGTVRHEKAEKRYSLREYAYEATGLLYFVLMEGGSGKLKSLVCTADDIRAFLAKVRRVAARRPAQRAACEERERQWRQEQQRREEQERLTSERNRQYQEEQQHFDEFYADVCRWRKAQEVRTYLAAFEQEYERRHGKIESGSQTDGWMRWLYGYADRLDPLTNIRRAVARPGSDNP